MPDFLASWIFLIIDKEKGYIKNSVSRTQFYDAKIQSVKQYGWAHSDLLEIMQKMKYLGALIKNPILIPPGVAISEVDRNCKEIIEALKRNVSKWRYP